MNILDKVKVLPFEGIKGTIEGIYKNVNTTKYFVRYFINSQIEEEYFYEDELEVL